MQEKVQNSQNKEVNCKLMGKFTVNFPDGSHIHLPIFEGESFREKIKDLVDQWYLDTKNEPEKYGHFDVNDKCPKCGGSLRCHILGNQAYLWCINDQCRYQFQENNPRARERVYEKFGLKTVWTHKSGCVVVLSNNPNRVNKK